MNNFLLYALSTFSIKQRFVAFATFVEIGTMSRNYYQKLAWTQFGQIIAKKGPQITAARAFLVNITISFLVFYCFPAIVDSTNIFTIQKIGTKSKFGSKHLMTTDRFQHQIVHCSGNEIAINFLVIQFGSNCSRNEETCVSTKGV